MKRLVQTMVPVLSLAVLGVGGVAVAGSTTQSAYCIKNADGSGRCYGTMLGFLNSAHGSTYARFYKNTSGTRSFYALYAPTSTDSAVGHSCTPDAEVSAIWDKAMQHRGYFSIQWDTAGTCNYLYLSNGSQYTNF